MSTEQPNNPLHGITLKQIVESLVDYYGWEQLGMFINIGCFNYKPSVTSSLRFLRQTPWARNKVENLYISIIDDLEQGKTWQPLTDYRSEAQKKPQKRKFKFEYHRGKPLSDRE